MIEYKRFKDVNIIRLGSYVIFIFLIVLGFIGCRAKVGLVAKEKRDVVKHEYTGIVEKVENGEGYKMVYFKGDVVYEVLGSPSVKPGQRINIKKGERGFEVAD